MSDPRRLPGVTTYGQMPKPKPLAYGSTPSALPKATGVVVPGVQNDFNFGDAYGESYAGRSRPLSGERKPTNWGGVAAGGASLLAGLLGGSKGADLSRSDFDSDPERLAKKRYGDLTDPNSDYNKGLLGRYMRIAGNATPGKDTLMAPIRAAGGGYMGSAAIAAQQAKGLTAKATNDAFEGWTSAVIGSEANASRYLGLEYERGMNETKGWTDYQQKEAGDEQDMWGDVANLGGTLLGMFL